MKSKLVDDICLLDKRCHQNYNKIFQVSNSSNTNTSFNAVKCLINNSDVNNKEKDDKEGNNLITQNNTMTDNENQNREKNYQDITTTQQCIDETFMLKYTEFVTEFDELFKDLMNGPKLNELASKFMSEHGEYLASFKPCVIVLNDETKIEITKYSSKNSSIFPSTTSIEIALEDMKILKALNGNSNSNNNIKVLETNYASIVSNCYRRACAGLYLSLTLEEAQTKVLKTSNERKLTLEFARRAFRMTPNDYDTNNWFFITTGYTIEYWPASKERAILSQLFRDTVERSISVWPKNYLSYNLLGRYFMSLGELSWVERALTKSFTSVKLDAGFEEAELMFLKAHELRNDWIATGLYMARVLLAQKKSHSKVREWIEFGLAQPVLEPTALIEREELLKLKSKFKY